MKKYDQSTGKLSLKRETLRVLQADSLLRAAGGYPGNQSRAARGRPLPGIGCTATGTTCDPDQPDAS